MQKPIYAFIDSQNLNLGVRSQGWVLDFRKFRIHLKDKYGVQKAFLFIGYIPDKQPLYDYLKSSGFTLIFKPTVEKTVIGEVTTKGNVDAELVLYCMIEIPNYSKAVIVSGDGDFYCLVEYLQKKNRLLKIITPNQKYSSLLRKYSSYISVISLFRKMVEDKKKK
ncbi:MAG: NYN domain-containing protein [Patescibacteria group bacterium]